MHSPIYRPRRLRQSETVRRIVRETRLSVDNLAMPFFVTHGRGCARDRVHGRELPTLVDELVREVKETAGLGVRRCCSSACGGQRRPRLEATRGTDRAASVRASRTPCRICWSSRTSVCASTRATATAEWSSGTGQERPDLELLARTALSHAEAERMWWPLDMMDGRVAAIREALDDSGFERRRSWPMPPSTPVVSTGRSGRRPSRHPVRRPPVLSDGPGQYRRALREVALDLDEGADMVMVKPALPTWMSLAREGGVRCSVAAYNVSGEFAMLKAAARLGWLDEERAMLEMLTAIRRAGADLILTYFAREAARTLRQQEH